MYNNRIASHRIASHRIASHRIASHRIASHLISFKHFYNLYILYSFFVSYKKIYTITKYFILYIIKQMNIDIKILFQLGGLLMT